MSTGLWPIRGGGQRFDYETRDLLHILVDVEGVGVTFHLVISVHYRPLSQGCVRVCVSSADPKGCSVRQSFALCLDPLTPSGGSSTLPINNRLTSLTSTISAFGHCVISGIGGGG